MRRDNNSPLAHSLTIVVCESACNGSLVFFDTFSSCSRVANRCRSITSRHYSHYSSCSFQLCTTSSSPRSHSAHLLLTPRRTLLKDVVVFLFPHKHTPMHSSVLCFLLTTPTQAHHHSLIIIVVSDSDTEPREQSSLSPRVSRAACCVFSLVFLALAHC